jgi:hypothetical protein
MAKPGGPRGVVASKAECAADLSSGQTTVVDERRDIRIVGRGELNELGPAFTHSLYEELRLFLHVRQPTPCKRALRCMQRNAACRADP